MPNTTLTITPTAPYDFLLLAAPYELPFPPDEARLRTHGYTRPLALASGDALCTLHEQGTIEAPLLTVTLHDLEADTATLAEAEALIRRMTLADLELEGFYTALADDPLVAPLTRRWRGMRPFLPPSMWEALTWQLTGVQVYKGMARAMWQRLCQAYGTRLVFGEQEFFACPRPERLAQCSYDELRGLRFSAQKCRYLVDAASAVAEGTLDIEGLRDLPQEAFHKEIRAITGVGPYLAEMLLLLSGRSAMRLTPDSRIQPYVADGYGLPKGYRFAALDDVMDTWGPWGALVIWYLWFDSEQQPR